MPSSTSIKHPAPGYRSGWVQCVVAALLAINAAIAETNLQVSLSNDGTLSWTNNDPNLYYTVEWRPSLSPTNSWNTTYRGLLDIRSSNSVITVPAPLFFRLSGSTSQVHTLTLTPNSSVFAEGYYKETNLSAVDPDFSAGNIAQGITMFGVNGALVPSGGTATPADVVAGKTFFGFNQTNWTLQAGTAGVFTCASGFYDLNGLAQDECEFQLDAQGIYVSAKDGTDDSTGGLGPIGTGSGKYPCRTIGFGLARAVALNRTNVYVANGVYNESITLISGRNLKGGYHPSTWSRDVDNTLTIVRGTNTGLHKKVVSGVSISQSLTVEGFVFMGQSADQPGANSYVFHLRDNPGLVRLQNNVIYAANGANGVSGSAGPSGNDGQPGATGSNAVAVSTCFARTGKAGGINTCSSGVNGGTGGGNVCFFTYNSKASAQAGSTGQGTGGGIGGAAGYDSRTETGGLCTVPTNGSTDGGAGGNGTNGANGNLGAGASIATGTISLNEWIGASGGSGSPGQNGAGGGGGGAGGGAQNNGGGATFGGQGGSGGAGGCGGVGGSAGGGGGASIAVFVSGGVAPIIQQTVIYLGRGGDGGSGGWGGMSGKGGKGGTGGTAGVFCSGAGGNGGDGGQGGFGGGGGGGAGGVSYGILVSGASSVPNYSAANTFSGGQAGQGGSAGQSMGNPGSAGVAGTTQFVNIR